jgi:copper resistance protein B
MISARTIAIVALGALLFAPAAAAETDAMILTFVEVERLEARVKDGKETLNWEAQGWIGEDYNKLWIKTEGEQQAGGKLEKAEVQVLYSRLVSDFFDVQAGVRHDFDPHPSRTFGVIGVQGLAPHFFEANAAAFVSDHGEVSARFEAEYDLLLTQRLVLQPSAEINVAAQSVRERGVGAGVNDVELGLRLRYEIRREFAPYVGLSWERKLGRTDDLARDAGEDVETLSFVVGLRMWF